MSIKQTYDADASKFLAEEAKMAASAAKLDRAYKGNIETSSQLEKQLLRTFQKALPPADRYKKELQALYELQKKGKISQEQYAAALDRTNKAYEEGEMAAGTAINSTIAKIGTLVGAYGGLTQAVRIYIEELNKKYELEKKAADIAVSRAGGQADALINMGVGLSSAERQAALEDIGSLAKEARIDKAVFLAEYAKAFSATSGDFETRRKQTSGIMQKLAPLFRGKEDQLGDFAGAAIDTMGSLGNVSEDQALAFMLTLQSQARVTSIDALRQAVPALAAGNITGGGDPWENAKITAAIFAAGGGRLGDPGGEETKTAVANFAAVLREMVPTDDNVPPELLKQLNEARGNRKKALQAQVDSMRAAGGGRELSVMERIRKIQGSKTLQDMVIPELKGRGVSKIVLEELLRGGVTGQKMDAAYEAFNDIDPTSLDRLRKDLTTLTPELAIREFQAGMDDANKTRLTLGDKEVSGVIRKALFQGTDEMPAMFEGQGWATRKMAKSRFEASLAANADPIAAARTAIDSGGFDPWTQKEMVDAINNLAAATQRQNEIAVERRMQEREQRKQKAVTPQP